MKKLKKAWRLFINRLGLWRGFGVVRWYQDGNTLYITVQRIGLFHQNVGLPFVCNIEIDPELVVHSPK